MVGVVGPNKGAVRAWALRNAVFFGFLGSVCDLSAKHRASVLNGAVPIFLGGIMPSARMALKPLN